MDYLKENLSDNFKLDTNQKVLTIPKSELKNIKLIISQILKTTNLTVFDICELALTINDKE